MVRRKPNANNRPNMCRFSLTYIDTTHWDNPIKIAKTPTYKLTKIPYLVRSGPTFIAVLGDKINAAPSIIGRNPVSFSIADRPIVGPSSSSCMAITDSVWI